MRLFRKCNKKIIYEHFEKRILHTPASENARENDFFSPSLRARLCAAVQLHTNEERINDDDTFFCSLSLLELL